MSTNGQKSDTGSATDRLVDSVDQMVRWPFQMTGATWDLMMAGMQAMTGSGRRDWGRNRSSSTSDTWSSERSSERSSSDRGSSSGQSWTSMFTGRDDQDLSGDDLKYVIWSIVFTKPGVECVLEPQHEELVNYDADGSSFAAVRIAKFLEKARHGHVEKPSAWREVKYAESEKEGERRSETTVVTTTGESAQGAHNKGKDRGWRIPSEDQKYIKFLYRVDRRLPKQESEVVERVTIERNTTSKIV